jgi:hypothetical protein
MKQRSFETRTLFIFTAFVISILNLLYFKSTLEIQLYDTYYILSQHAAAQLLSLVCIVFFVIYFAFSGKGKPLRRNLGLVHYALTIIPAFLCLLKPSQDIETLTQIALLVMVLIVLGQAFLFANIFITLKKADDPFEI